MIFRSSGIMTSVERLLLSTAIEAFVDSGRFNFNDDKDLDEMVYVQFIFNKNIPCIAMAYSTGYKEIRFGVVFGSNNKEDVFNVVARNVPKNKNPKFGSWGIGYMKNGVLVFDRDDIGISDTIHKQLLSTFT